MRFIIKQFKKSKDLKYASIKSRISLRSFHKSMLSYSPYNIYIWFAVFQTTGSEMQGIIEFDVAYSICSGLIETCNQIEHSRNLTLHYVSQFQQGH